MNAQAVLVPSATLAEPLLAATDLDAGYRNLEVLHGVTLSVAAAEAVGIIGHNGAGKTTVLRTLFGNIRPTAGAIRYSGVTQPASRCADSIRRGMAFVPADNYLFGPLTVRENLQIAKLNATSAAQAAEQEQLALDLFPAVAARLGQTASTLSGGERRMLGIAMSLMWRPRLILLDEPTLGLAPAVAVRVFSALSHLIETTGISVLCVEQNVTQLLSLVSRVYIIRSGRIIGEKTSAQLSAEPDLWSYF